MVDTDNPGPSRKAKKKNSRNHRITWLENAVKQLEAENLKTKAQIAAIRSKLDSLDRRIDRHEAGFEHLATSSAESSEKLHESLRGKIPE